MGAGKGQKGRGGGGGGEGCLPADWLPSLAGSAGPPRPASEGWKPFIWISPDCMALSKCACRAAAFGPPSAAKPPCAACSPQQQQLACAARDSSPLLLTRTVVVSLAIRSGNQLFVCQATFLIRVQLHGKRQNPAAGAYSSAAQSPAMLSPSESLSQVTH